jgi:hypothetical protein
VLARGLRVKAKQPASSANRNFLAMPHTKATDKESQSDEFKKLARKLECDEDEARWDARMRKLTKAKMDKPE